MGFCGRGRGAPEALDALRLALAGDPALHVLIGQGLFEVVTPFDRTRVLLNQIPLMVGGDRVKLVTYPCGHIFDSRDPSCVAFRAEAEAIMDGSARP